MSVTEREVTIEALPAAHETCEQCEAPVDSNQRYCVVCGTRRKHVHDPAARFLAEATRRSRARPRAQATRPPAHRSSSLWVALLLAAIPLAVAAGVLIGRPGDGVNNKLLAALRAQKPPVVNVGGGSSAGATTASAAAADHPTAAPVAALKSSFGLSQGWAVELQTLPRAGTTLASVSAAERRARSHGAPAVGLISQSDFTVSPAPPAGAYVIYSGQYRSSAAATAALAKLKHAFPGAKVISVRAAGSTGGGKVLARTSYGSAHEISGFKPSKAQLSSGASVVKKVSQEINGNYVKSQQGLPDSVSVP